MRRQLRWYASAALAVCAQELPLHLSHPSLAERRLIPIMDQPNRASPNRATPNRACRGAGKRSALVQDAVIYSCI